MKAILYCMVFSLSLWSISTSLRLADSERPDTNGNQRIPKRDDSGRSKICDRFVILSMQRSGSRFIEKLLNDDPLTGPSTRCEGEFFSFGEGQPGRKYADLLNITPDDIRRHGVRWWYQEVFGLLEQRHNSNHGAKSPCVVGFRAFENIDAYGKQRFWGGKFGFNYDEIKPLLEDRTVKKIILERKDTKAQWLSIQRACWFHDMSDHHDHDPYIVQRHLLTQQLQMGKSCGPPGISNFTLYEQTKVHMYRRWYAYMDADHQPYADIKTEHLDKLRADPSQLHRFLFQPQQCEQCSKVMNTISDLKRTVDDHYPNLIKQHVELRDTPDPREGMSDIHVALLPGYKIVGESHINLSELPWVFQCGIESAVRTGSKVTLWYRDFPEGHVHDDITDGKLQLKRHVFQSGTQTGDWWLANSNASLTFPKSEVIVSDYIRQDILHRFGGIFMDLDVIILDDRLPHGPDGLSAQHVNDVWKGQASGGNYLKYSPTTRFGQCMFDIWKLHWDVYLSYHAECVGRCSQSDERDFDDLLGFMGPSLVTRAYLSCKDGNVSVYPPSAFGNDPYPCNLGLVQDDAITLKGNAYALHTCNKLAIAVEDLGANLKRNTTMANVMQDRCPKTSMRMYSSGSARKKNDSQSRMAYFLMDP